MCHSRKVFLFAAAVMALGAGYRYDEQNRLVEVVYSNGVRIDYDYDKAGNIRLAAYTLADPNNDTDGDSIPDSWEQQHGLNPLDPSDAKIDSDGDQIDNQGEFVAATDPNDPRSVLKFVTKELVAPARHRLQWPSVQGTNYVLERTTNFHAWHYVSNGIADTAPTNTLVIDADFSPVFYRVRRQLLSDKE